MYAFLALGLVAVWYFVTHSSESAPVTPVTPPVGPPIPPPVNPPIEPPVTPVTPDPVPLPTPSVCGPQPPLTAGWRPVCIPAVSLPASTPALAIGTPVEITIQEGDRAKADSSEQAKVKVYVTNVDPAGFYLLSFLGEVNATYQLTKKLPPIGTVFTSVPVGYVNKKL